MWWQRLEEQLRDRFDVFLSELRQTVQARIEVTEGFSEVEGLGAAGDGPVPQVCAVVATMARGGLREMLNMHVVENGTICIEYLRMSEALLEEPLQRERIAEAYDLVRVASFELGTEGETKTWRECHRKVARIIRDLLILACCLGQGPFDSGRLQATMTRVFHRLIDAELFSQMSLTFNTILRMGRERGAFDEVSNRVYGQLLDAGKAEQLFDAYSTMASASLFYVSRSKAVRRKPRNAKKKDLAKRSNDITEVPSSSGEQKMPSEST